MASNYTENYGLCQWEATDGVLRTDFNEDNTKIDAALKSQAGSISSLSAQMVNKANTGAVNSLSNTVNQKADRSELEAEKTARINADNVEQSAREAADAALEEKAGMQLIQRVTLSESTERLTLDLSYIDWSQWATIRIVLKAVKDFSDNYRVYCSSQSALCTVMWEYFLMVLYPTFDPAFRISGSYWPCQYTNNLVDYGTPFNQLDYVRFDMTNNVFFAGTIAEVWGNR